MGQVQFVLYHQLIQSKWKKCLHVFMIAMLSCGRYSKKQIVQLVSKPATLDLLKSSNALLSTLSSGIVRSVFIQARPGIPPARRCIRLNRASGPTGGRTGILLGCLASNADVQNVVKMKSSSAMTDYLLRWKRNSKKELPGTKTIRWRFSVRNSNFGIMAIVARYNVRKLITDQSDTKTICPITKGHHSVALVKQRIRFSIIVGISPNKITLMLRARLPINLLNKEAANASTVRLKRRYMRPILPSPKQSSLTKKRAILRPPTAMVSIRNIYAVYLANFWQSW